MLVSYTANWQLPADFPEILKERLLDFLPLTQKLQD
jgi:hypothetical protein